MIGFSPPLFVYFWVAQSKISLGVLYNSVLRYRFRNSSSAAQPSWIRFSFQIQAFKRFTWEAQLAPCSRNKFFLKPRLKLGCLHSISSSTILNLNENTTETKESWFSELAKTFYNYIGVEFVRFTSDLWLLIWNGQKNKKKLKFRLFCQFLKVSSPLS